MFNKLICISITYAKASYLPMILSYKRSILKKILDLSINSVLNEYNFSSYEIVYNKIIRIPITIKCVVFNF